MARNRLRQVVDLYVKGIEVPLKDGSAVWAQILNPFEQDTARNEAQIAKARLSLALKEHGSGETAKVRMYFFEDGIDAARAKVVDTKVAESMPKILEQLRNDPEWTERLDIMDRGLDGSAKPAEQMELELLEALVNQYTVEISDRLEAERQWQEAHFATAGEDDVWEAYKEWYLNRRSAELQLAEFKLHQMYFAARVCEGIKLEDGTWDHVKCESHTERLFLSTDEVRDAPEDLMAVLLAGLEEIEMSVRDAKNSDRQGSSSDSSPLPRPGEESTPSTPTETRADAPGTSPSPSATP